MKLFIHSQISTVAPFKFGNRWIISSRTLWWCYYLSILRLKLISVGKCGPRYSHCNVYGSTFYYNQTCVWFIQRYKTRFYLFLRISYGGYYTIRLYMFRDGFLDDRLDVCRIKSIFPVGYQIIYKRITSTSQTIKCAIHYCKIRYFVDQSYLNMTRVDSYSNNIHNDWLLLLVRYLYILTLWHGNASAFLGLYEENPPVTIGGFPHWDQLCRSLRLSSLF